MGPILEAIRLFARYPRLLKYSVQPLLITVGLFTVLMLATWAIAFVPVQAAMSGYASGDGAGVATALVQGMVGIAIVSIWVILAGFLFIAVATLVSAFLFEGLSAEVEELLTGTAPRHRHHPAAVAVDSLKRLLLMAMVGLASLCASSIPLLPIFFAGYPATLDYTAPTYSRRGILLGGQMRSVYRVRGVWGFHAIAGLVTLVPILNLLMLPIMVAAGTILVVKNEKVPS